MSSLQLAGQRIMHRESQERNRMGFGVSRELEETVKKGFAPHVAKRMPGTTYADMAEQSSGETGFRIRGSGMSSQGIGVRRIGSKNTEHMITYKSKGKAG
jgi:hypothetical protein